MATIAAPRAKALQLVKQLLAIPGGSGREKQVAQFIEAELLAAGAEKSWFRYDKAHQQGPIADAEVGNLVVTIPGTIAAPRRLLMAHMDTVPLCVGCTPVRKGDVLESREADRGLGADDRAGVAVVLHAACQILRKKLPHPPLTLLFTIEEEIGLHGAKNLQTSLLKKPALAFNWDGGSPTKLTIGAIGGYRMFLDVHGIASHAGVAPERGASAITIASLAIARLHKAGWLGKITKKKRVGTANVGVINGGAATNVVCDSVQLKAEARSHDVAFLHDIVAQIEAAFRDAAAEVKNVDGQSGSVDITGRLDYEPFLLSKDEPSVQVAQQTLAALGLESELSIANGGLDANWLFRHGVPAVTFGCGQRNQHMATEQLHLESFYQACDIGLNIAVGK
ncbi:M20/M25/M40 family metallo-hydrolase [Blastopirellula sp. J2-11]|uniref:M20/M25/M40 family metallo-hydrolase n=1 Tax=Blastopirellula sp. J2-11 TaxID=2943192 RepID=UPI0021C5C67B|nr:M20/M25/M40 family metallo-hydrolase [Blastopirellula sp. J2-11]UUO06659.1 M20/M25/M40 family metallo-hydrolase [Blastopirellula sp. J2-11]